MLTSTVPISRYMSKITQASHIGNDIHLTFIDDNKGVIKMRYTSELGIDRFIDDCIGKKIVEITRTPIPYSDSTHPYEHTITYCGGVILWNTYESYTFHYDDETVTTIELTYTSGTGVEPYMTMEDEDLTPIVEQLGERPSILEIIKDLWYY